MKAGAADANHDNISPAADNGMAHLVTFIHSYHQLSKQCSSIPLAYKRGNSTCKQGCRYHSIILMMCESFIQHVPGSTHMTVAAVQQECKRLLLT
jgi:hypothetical protein